MSERVRYVADGDGVYRVAGHHFRPGDCLEVTDALAEHLVGTGQFEKEPATTVEYREIEETNESETADLNQQDGSNAADELVKDGICPWCDDYDGENVGLHASQAHPDEWAAYKED